MEIQNSNNQLVHCDCGTPVAKRLNSRKLEFLKYNKGQSIKLSAEYSGNKCVVHCEKCGRDITFLTNEIQLGLSYAVAPLKS